MTLSEAILTAVDGILLHPKMQSKMKGWGGGLPLRRLSGPAYDRALTIIERALADHRARQGIIASEALEQPDFAREQEELRLALAEIREGAAPDEVMSKLALRSLHPAWKSLSRACRRLESLEMGQSGARGLAHYVDALEQLAMACLRVREAEHEVVRITHELACEQEERSAPLPIASE
jgi:hypothetical protein